MYAFNDMLAKHLCLLHNIVEKNEETHNKQKKNQMQSKCIFLNISQG